MLKIRNFGQTIHGLAGEAFPSHWDRSNYAPVEITVVGLIVRQTSDNTYIGRGVLKAVSPCLLGNTLPVRGPGQDRCID